MHNISTQQIKELANQLAQAASSEKTEELLIRVRELYEQITLLHHQTSIEKPVTITDKTDNNALVEEEVTEKKELTVQERIQQIMSTAPKFTPTIVEPLKKEASVFDHEIVEKSEKKIPNEPIELQKETTASVSLEEELKDAISADYAADLFENAEKIELTKKSLNDSLSQAQIQIGLNDRIAFVKHLFDGNQTDFNRVLSQLNSFHSEIQAKDFIKNRIKPEYNWNTKIEYEERLMILIERKFL